VLIVLAFVLANRFSGGGAGWPFLNKYLPFRPLHYASVALAVALGAAYGLPGVLAAVSFLLWRTPGWFDSHRMGTGETAFPRDLAVMFARGLLAFPLFAYEGAYALLVALAAAIAVSYALALRGPFGAIDRLAIAELLAGAAWGVAIATLLL